MPVDRTALSEAQASMFSGDFHDALSRYRAALGIVGDNVKGIRLAENPGLSALERETAVEMAAAYHLSSIQEFHHNGINGIGILHAEKSLEINRGSHAFEIHNLPGDVFLQVALSDPFIYLATFYIRRGLCKSAVDYHRTGSYDRQAEFEDFNRFFCLSLEGLCREGGMDENAIGFVREYAEIVLRNRYPDEKPERMPIPPEGAIPTPQPEFPPILSAEEFTSSPFGQPAYDHVVRAGFSMDNPDPKKSEKFREIVDTLFFRPLGDTGNDGKTTSAMESTRRNADKEKHKKGIAKTARRRNRRRSITPG